MSPMRPTLNIVDDRLTVMQQSSPGRKDSMQASDLSRDKPFAYKDFNMSPITRKAKFRELFMEHFEKARKETKDWKPTIVSAMD